jgi:hypothetical protein
MLTGANGTVMKVGRVAIVTRGREFFTQCHTGLLSKRKKLIY